MSIPAPDVISIEDPLCNSSLGSMVTLDYVTPLTVQETQHYREMFEESGAAQSAAGPETHRLDKEMQNFDEKYDFTIMTE